MALTTLSRLPTVFIVLLLLAASPVLAQTQAPPPPACPAGTPRIRLTLVDPEPVVSRELGIDALHGETGEPRSDTLHHLGLTTSRVEWHSEIETRYRSGPRGVCARPAVVVLNLVQTEHIVRIARELRPGSCLYREVLAHEQRHVAVNRRTLQRAATRARAAAEAWATNALGRSATLDEAMESLQLGLHHAIEPALTAMRNSREAGHRVIDTEEEYSRLSRICPADQRALRELLRPTPP